MCRIERKSCEFENNNKREMGLKAMGGVEKLRSSMSVSMSRSRMKLWMIRATTSVLLWTCIVQLTALGDLWGPRVLKGWPSCFLQDSSSSSSSAAVNNAVTVPSVPPRVLPPKSEFFLFFLCLIEFSGYFELIEVKDVVLFGISIWV